MDAVRRSLLLSPLAAWATLNTLAADKETSAAKRQGLRRDDAWMPKLSENLKDVEPGTLRCRPLGLRSLPQNAGAASRRQPSAATPSQTNSAVTVSQRGHWKRSGTSGSRCQAKL